MIQKNNVQRVSIVIPVYNEAAHLRTCLLAIQAQSVAPYEVIVIDNNSTDQTRSIAGQFDFVNLVSEKRQGVVHARTTGFNVAQGDIIGRIDADTILSPEWITTVQRIMANDQVAAVSGSVYYYDVIKPVLSGKFDIFFRQRLARQLADEVFLCGSNMAVRRSAWLGVRRSLCDRAGLHEDFDLAIHLEQRGQQVIFDEALRAGISLRRFGTGLINCWRYMQLSPRTYKVHGRRSQRHMYPIIAVVLLGYWFIWFNCRAYNIEKEHLSLRQLRLPSDIRVNPATYVD